MNTSEIRIGGLFRCCIEAVHEDAGPDEEGRVIECPWCHDELIFKDGAWEWAA